MLTVEVQDAWIGNADKEAALEDGAVSGTAFHLAKPFGDFVVGKLKEDRQSERSIRIQG